VTNAGVQDGALGASNPLFYVALVRDDGSKGNVVRYTHRLPVLVDCLPQHDLTRPRLIGIREPAFGGAPFFKVRAGTDEKRLDRITWCRYRPLGEG